MANIGDYETTYANFEWGIPEKFNFGRDVVDHWAQEEDRLAMLWLGKDGEERRLTFKEVSLASNRFANVMRNLGVKRGDRVMLVLGKVPEWQIILTGLLKLGAIVVPSVDQLRADDLKFRTEHSGTVAIISGASGAPEVEAMRDEVSGVQHYVFLEGEREGWESYEKLAEDVSKEFTAEDTTSDEGAIMLYTSGTTKHPKGALHTHAYTYAKRMQSPLLARPPGRRQTVVHRRDRLGQGCVERVLGPMESGYADVHARGGIRPRRAPGPDKSLRDNRPMPGSD